MLLLFSCTITILTVGITLISFLLMKTKSQSRKKYFTSRQSVIKALGYPPRVTCDSDQINDKEVIIATLPSSAFFHRLREPRSGDWLKEQTETGQPFEEFRRRIRAYGMTRAPQIGCNRIMLVLLGNTTFNNPVIRGFVRHIKQYCEAYFTPMPVDLYPHVLSLDGVRHRKNQYGHDQFLLNDLYDLLDENTSSRLDVYCRLGITFEDIYPGDDWNFVYGEARPLDKNGIFSFARHSPLFHKGIPASDMTLNDTGGSGISNGDAVEWLRATLRTMVHETIHLFNIHHCIYYHCVMNGSNGDHDSAGRFSFLCPVCLRKVLHMLASSQANVTVPYSSARRSIGVALPPLPLLQQVLVSPTQRYERICNVLIDIRKSYDCLIDNDNTVPIGSGCKQDSIHGDIAWLQERIEYIRSLSHDPQSVWSITDVDFE